MSEQPKFIPVVNTSPLHAIPAGSLAFLGVRSAGPGFLRRLWNRLRGEPTVNEVTYRFVVQAVDPERNR